VRELKKTLMRKLFTEGLGDAELKETEIGTMPKHWDVVRLGEVMKDRIKNGAFIKKDQFGEGVLFLNVADVYKNAVVNIRTLGRVRCTENDLDNYALKPNDLAFVRSSLKYEGVGQCCIVEELEEPVIFDCHLMRVTPDTSMVVPKFITYYCLSPKGKQALIARSKKTTMTTINQSGLSNVSVPLPPHPEQQEIARILSTVDKKIEVEENRKRLLQELFKTMLHKLMTGQIRVKDLEV